jgi:heme exporter protein D
MNNQSSQTIAAIILQTDANQRTELLQDIARELQKQHQFHIAKCIKYAASLHED